MKYLLCLLLIIPSLAWAVPVKLSCDAPIERESGEALTGPITYQYYKNGQLIPEASGLEYSYNEQDQSKITYTVTATDENGVISKLSAPVSINLSPPNPCSITVTITTVN